MEFLHGGDDLFAKVEAAWKAKGWLPGPASLLNPDEAFGDYDADLVCFGAQPLPRYGVDGWHADGRPARKAPSPRHASLMPSTP